MKNDVGMGPFWAIFALGCFLGSFLVYISNVKGNYQLAENRWKCIDAEIVNSTISPAECSLLIRTDSEAYKNYQRMTNDSSN